MTFVQDFIALFRHTTNSYKYLFLKSVINRAKNGEFVLSIDDVVLDILVYAWYPNQYFKLSFGVQDKVGNLFRNQDFNFNDIGAITSTGFTTSLRDALSKEVNKVELKKELARYVQYRLLSPFFAEELRGQPDGKKNRMIKESAAARYDSRKPLYRISECSKKIETHPEWGRFIQDNYPLLLQYLESRWVAFLQKQNPEVPAIIHKTAPPASRSSLSRQRAYWGEFLKKNCKSSCIYAGTPLPLDNFSLDHFLPWSFVCHDRVWNLVPTTVGINSSKGNSLPNLELYLENFIDFQLAAMRYHSKNNHKWELIAAEIASDLKISPQLITIKESVVSDKLCSYISTQHQVAEQLGFTTWALCN
ncbi:HNH endonuclease domain-containing protein [Salinimonas sediminis]|uniref:HNH nuclease domain-containing protein n=1 Tax=Salinimonas sediminis TaxID=2303538 RepID=A0A346NRU7_9ALTE|nr:HNH endonuclease domain-containing protein [Salinimonas sediminis]AXR08254.1 hypothetical protein D0Y50_18960 [Salinimonas sediminis]